MISAGDYGVHELRRTFGDVLRAARTERGVSQDRLAMLCDFDRTYPSLLERGLRLPTMCMIYRRGGR